MISVYLFACVCSLQTASMGLFMKLDGIPEPPEGYVPPLGSSRNTWTNIYKNKGRIDYCVQQFGVSCLVSRPFF